MVKKQPIRHRIKAVIEALKEGKKTWSELVNLGIPEKTLERVLKDYLIYWGLVRKEGDYYVWHEYVRTFQTPREYEVFLRHSKQIVPELFVLISSKFSVSKNHYYNAREHLRTGYPEIYEKLLKIEAFFGKRLEKKEQRDKNLRMESFRVFDEHYLAQKAFRGDVTWIYDVHKAIHTSYDVLYDIVINEDMINLSTALSRDLLFIASKVINGEPLKGKCPLCPNIKVLNKSENTMKPKT